MKKLISIFLTIALLLGSFAFTSAADAEANAAADTLYALGLFSGTGKNADGTPVYSLDRAPTRNEAITMLVNLLGKAEEAKAGTWETPFTDVADWAKPFVGYAYANKLTSGTGDTTFGGDSLVTATQYLTFVLRALGYENGTDFQWNKAWELTDKLGITDGEYGADSSFLRGDVVKISRSALSAKLKGSEVTLAQKMIREGVFTQEAYDAAMKPAETPQQPEPQQPAAPVQPSQGGAVWSGAVASSFAGGSGSENDPYHIKTAEQLAYLAQQVNDDNPYYDTFFVLDNDIDLGGVEWTPIGDYEHNFNGSFDGQKHVVQNLSITKADEFPIEGNDWHKSVECIGLFGSAGAASTVMNLTVTGKIHVDKPNAPDYDDVLAGGVIGFAHGLIKNCHSKCDVYVSVPSTGTYVNAGGMIGVFSWKGVLIDGCSNTGSVYGYSGECTRCGGIAGDCDGYGKVINCWNSGEVTAEGTTDEVSVAAGGMCCHTWSAQIVNCCNFGKISGGYRVGGILAYQNGEEEDGEGCITNCWSTGTVHAEQERTIGYIAGGLYYGYIDACYGVNAGSLAACSDVRDGELRTVRTYSSSQMQELCDALNAWVKTNNASGEYAEWVIPSGSAYPVPAGK